jgi:hypothetical protein
VRIQLGYFGGLGGLGGRIRLARMVVPKLAKNGFLFFFWGLGTLLNLAQVHLFSVAASLSGIQETELKPFLTIFGTGMRT